MSPGSNTESYPAFDRIGLRENPEKNLNQTTGMFRCSSRYRQRLLYPSLYSYVIYSEFCLHHSDYLIKMLGKHRSHDRRIACPLEYITVMKCIGQHVILKSQTRVKNLRITPLYQCRKILPYQLKRRLPAGLKMRSGAGSISAWADYLVGFFLRLSPTCRISNYIDDQTLLPELNCRRIAFRENSSKGYILNPTMRFEHHKGQPEEVNNEKRSINEPTLNYTKRNPKLTEIKQLYVILTYLLPRRAFRPERALSERCLCRPEIEEMKN
ncbi:hypothetical protein ANN_03089 [Periplaneta americana]|uniref:Uncharacterized protein n=1 Tax=Periplaneta americana TaxID=6978 RepID=A0ABQ8U2X4_PERAM|nr:hypothetical protein ANN_03089 [Periplaneta americana]